MKIKLLFISILSIFSSISFAQGSGCAQITTGPDQTLNCSTTCTDITASVFEVGETNVYSVNSIAYAPPISFNYPGGNPVSVNTDDVWSGIINLPFDFCYFGQTYTTCKIGSNGAIRMGPTSGGGYHPYPFTASCPSPDLVEAGNIFGPYHDIDPSVSGTVKWHLLGTSPCRTLVVTFNDIAHYDCSSKKSSFMIVLYETTNIIEMYLKNKPTCTSWNGGRAVLGIQNVDGTQGYTAPSRNTGSWTTSNEAWIFKPDGTPIFSTVEWYNSTGVLIGSGSTINVCPTEETNIYTAKTTYTGCNGSSIPVENDITVNYSPSPYVSIIPSNIYSCSGQSLNLEATTLTPVSYLWSTGATTSTIAVSPVVTTQYYVTVTDLTSGCVGYDTSVVNISQPATNSCNVFYVDTTGTPAGLGTKSSPLDLKTAISLGACNGTIIKMAKGTYSIDTTITTLTSFITLEGGYDPITWEKSSEPELTRIFRTNTNITDPTGLAPRLIAIEIIGMSGFRFQDITIEVEDAPAPTGLNKGISTYGLYMRNCTDYDIVRTKIIAGDASNGVGDDNPSSYNAFWDGQDGSDGTNGGTGSAGESTCNIFSDDDGGNGGTAGTSGNGGVNASGVSSPNGTNGFNGGIGGDGEDEGGGGGQDGAIGAGPGGAGGLLGANDGGNDDTPYGGFGGFGTNGTSGINGTISTSSSYLLGYYNPSQASNGTAGTGGTGGGGAGGGGQDSGGCDAAGGGGSGGGGGGGGAGAGKGASGGGSAYDVFVFANGTGGSIIDCQLINGSLGQGGIGGSGGNGGDGGSSSLGNGHSDGDSNLGGAGGNGGNGGNGGDGGDATDGEAFSIFVDGNLPNYINDGNNIALVLSGNNPANFDLTGQDIITADDVACTNTDMDYNSAISNSWDLGAGSSNTTPTGTSVTTQYTTLGRKNINYNSETYTGFSNILLDAQITPIITTNAQLVGTNYTVCVGESVIFNATNGNTSYIYNWQLGANASPLTSYSGLGIDNVTTTYTTPGIYTIELFYETNCCGQTNTTTLDIHVVASPTVVMPADEDICLGNNGGVTLSVTSTPNGTVSWSPATGLNNTNSYTVVALPTVSTTYFVTVADSTGFCSVQDSVKVNVTDLQLAMSSTVSSCILLGTANVVVTGGSGSYSYMWSNGSTTQNISNLQAGVYSVVVTDDINGCVDSNTVIVTAGAGAIVATSTTSDILCFGGNNGNITVNVSGGTSPYTYDWSNGFSETTANLFSSQSGLSAGIDTLTITDNTGCVFIVYDTIVSPDEIVFALDSVYSPCFGVSNGYINIRPNGGVSPYTFSWSNGMTVVEVNDDVEAANLVAGTYTLYLTDANGCQDSISISLNSTTYSDTLNSVLCFGDTYVFPNSTTLTATSDTTVSFNTACDSLVVFNLTVLPNPTSFLNAFICGGGTYTLPSGTIVNSQGVYLDTINSSTSCDSVITVTLTVENILNTMNTTICSGQSYVLPDGSSTSLSGTYTFANLSANGCDSTFIVELYVEDTITTLENIMICNGESYTLPNGDTESEQGSYFSNLLTLNGCDSIIKTNLIVFMSDTLFIDTVMSEVTNTFVLPDGTTITDVGEYESLLSYINGCDSLIVITKVRAVKEWTMPNVFSPNASQDVNKVFTIINQHGFVELVELQIYNRWGQKIFDNIIEGKDFWNGNYKGILQSAGNYTYIVKVKDSQGIVSDYYSGNFLLVW